MKNITFLESTKKMPLMSLPVRTELISLGERSLLLSPGSMFTVEQFKALGSVTDIVAPNLLHSAGVPNASKAFPQAKVWGPPGARAAKPQIRWTDELTEATWAFHNEMPLVLVGGAPRLSEIVFFHKESKSLIVTDLVFNLTEARGIGSWIILNMFGTYRKFGVSRLLMKMYVEDKNAFRNSMKEILIYDFDNILMSHGSPIIGNAKPRFLNALAERNLLETLPQDL